MSKTYFHGGIGSNLQSSDPEWASRVLLATRPDAYIDSTYGISFQGVRSADENSGQWATPDWFGGYDGDVMSQQPYMWNGDNGLLNQDPSGYVYSISWGLGSLYASDGLDIPMIFDIAADLLITNADLNDLKKRLKGIACTSKSIDDNTGRIFSFSVGGHQTSFTISELGFVTAGGAFGGAATNTAGSYLFYQGGGLLGGLGGGLIPGAGETGTTEIAGYFAGARIGTAIWNFPAVRGPLDALGAGAGSAVGDSAYKAAAAAVDRFCRR